MKLSRAEEIALNNVGWGTFHFGGLCTRRSTGTKAIRSLVARGLVKQDGYAVVCNGDGFSESDAKGRERFGMAWSLTDAGVQACDQWRDDIQAKSSGRTR